GFRIGADYQRWQQVYSTLSYPRLNVPKPKMENTEHGQCDREIEYENRPRVRKFAERKTAAKQERPRNRQQRTNSDRLENLYPLAGVGKYPAEIVNPLVQQHRHTRDHRENEYPGVRDELLRPCPCGRRQYIAPRPQLKSRDKTP